MEGKTSMQIWGTMKNILGDQGNIAKVFGIKESKLSFKTLQGTRGSINEEQGIKSKEIKGSWEHLLSPPMDGLCNFQRLSNFELKSKKQTHTGNLLRQSQSLSSPVCF